MARDYSHSKESIVATHCSSFNLGYNSIVLRDISLYMAALVPVMSRFQILTSAALHRKRKREREREREKERERERERNRDKKTLREREWSQNHHGPLLNHRLSNLPSQPLKQ